MPTYEYVCKDCGHLFEIVRSMKDDPLTECPECGGTLRKVFAPPAIAFKGSGFYATDHGKNKQKEKAAQPSGQSSGQPSGSKDKGTNGSGSSGASETSTSSSPSTSSKEKPAPASKASTSKTKDTSS